MKLSVWKMQFVILVVLLLSCSVVLYRSFFIPHNILTVAFLDVGQGDAIFIEAPNGNQVLIDGGNTDGKALAALGKEMSFFDRYMDVVIATHPDQDHIGGLPEIFKRYKVGAFFASGSRSENGVYEATEIAAEEDGAQKFLARGGEIIRLDKNTSLQLLYPDRVLPPGADANLSSIVVKLTYGNETFLFTGDLPQGEEIKLVKKYGAELQSNVLKFGHHGSKTSTSPEFLAAVSPKFGVVSVGADNKYGHPNKETLDLAVKDNVKVIRTDEEGSIVFKTDGASLSIL